MTFRTERFHWGEDSVFTWSVKSAVDYDPNQPRDPDGKWTGGGASFEFMSPNVGQLKLPEAVKELKSSRQKQLHEASKRIDQELGLQSERFQAIGAWSDGAENSQVSAVTNGDWNKLKVAAAMKAHLADQKQALVFRQGDGEALLYNMQVSESDVEKLHQNLMADGLMFHTIVPTSSGADVYVADLDGSAHDAMAKAAERYNGEVTYYTGQAEFIGTTKEDGTDREQRDDARRAYAEIIQQSPVQESQGVWERVHNHWGETLGLAPPSDKPMTVFHGTIENYVNKIKTEGLKVVKQHRHFDGDFYAGDRGESVFVTTNQKTAIEYANNQAQEQSWKDYKEVAPILFRLEIPPDDWKNFQIDRLEKEGYYSKAIPPAWIKETFKVGGGDELMRLDAATSDNVTAYMVVFVGEPK